jgi:hypothetical protein
MLSLLGTGVEINEPRIPEEEIQGVLSEYRKIRKLKLEEIFNMYNMDYIILDPKYSFYKETKSILDNLAFVNEVASFDGKVIYKVGKIGKNIQ